MNRSASPAPVRRIQPAQSIAVRFRQRKEVRRLGSVEVRATRRWAAAHEGRRVLRMLGLLLVSRVRRVHEAAFLPRFQAVFAHQSLDALHAHARAVSRQLAQNARASVQSRAAPSAPPACQSPIVAWRCSSRGQRTPERRCALRGPQRGHARRAVPGPPLRACRREPPATLASQRPPQLTKPVLPRPIPRVTSLKTKWPAGRGAHRPGEPLVREAPPEASARLRCRGRTRTDKSRSTRVLAPPLRGTAPSKADSSLFPTSSLRRIAT